MHPANPISPLQPRHRAHDAPRQSLFNQSISVPRNRPTPAQSQTIPVMFTCNCPGSSIIGLEVLLATCNLNEHRTYIYFCAQCEYRINTAEYLSYLRWQICFISYTIIILASISFPGTASRFWVDSFVRVCLPTCNQFPFPLFTPPTVRILSTNPVVISHFYIITLSDTAVFKFPARGHQMNPTYPRVINQDWMGQ
ncbi:hypothetical protein ASPBRDRAFT_307814 [Aspergillus brasiliensis CBS 101740]|uniref:Uncharacterized protein n=1 Tax=Aspergillus brasiliensis (strain CBS 101740 / IMI 381727 / IBT 21946) TaxID=767769 RepID=A0A1L9UAH8_ASPBC|nr:hypothetical protein ASPBRDRAFT_307814 [Aspergillus brasiliensis CBS 101740]